MDTEILTLNAWVWKQSPWNRTLALKQNAERLNSDPERLTDPKRFNINAENAKIRWKLEAERSNLDIGR